MRRTRIVPPVASIGPFNDLYRVGWSLLGLGGAGVGITAGYVWSNIAVGTSLVVLWCLAVFSVAMAVGFLFGVPKVLQAPLPKPQEGSAPLPQQLGDTGYGQRVNTNLEEISDWLTKIIVGMTLINLKELPDLLYRLSALVVRDLPSPAAHLGLAAAIVLFFSAVGGLFGYLVTRLYIQSALARAEGDIAGEVRRRQQELEERLQETAIQLPAAGKAAPESRAAEPRDLSKLMKAADEYLEINIPDRDARTAAKTKAAETLATLASELGVSKPWLAQQDHEGLLLALAAYVQAKPESGDATLLIRAAPRVSRLHVRYRFVLAFSVLIKAGLVTAGELRPIRETLSRFEIGADESLLNIILAVRDQLAAARKAGNS